MSDPLVPILDTKLASTVGLPEENLREVPFGSSRCRFCNLPLEELKEIHRLFFEEHIGYKKMRLHIKEKYGWGNDFSSISKHFKKHCRLDANRSALVKSSTKNAMVAEVIQSCPTGIQTKRTNRNVEKAYDQLVKMTATFTDTVNKMFEHYRVTYSNDPQKLLEAMEALGPINSLNLLSNLNRMAREQVKDVSAIRAPKVLVVQFLEDTFDKAIQEINDVAGSLFIQVQEEFMKIMDQHNLKNEVSDRLFTEAFKKIAMSYRDRILTLRQVQLMKAVEALTSMDKIV